MEGKWTLETFLTATVLDGSRSSFHQVSCLHCATQSVCFGYLAEILPHSLTAGFQTKSMLVSGRGGGGDGGLNGQPFGGNAINFTKNFGKLRAHV